MSLTFTKADTDELELAINRFCETKLPEIVPDVARLTAKSVLKDLKSRWPNEHTLQETDVSGFRERVEERWGNPLQAGKEHRRVLLPGSPKSSVIEKPQLHCLAE